MKQLYSVFTCRCCCSSSSERRSEPNRNWEISIKWQYLARAHQVCHIWCGHFSSCGGCCCWCFYAPFVPGESNKWFSALCFFSFYTFSSPPTTSRLAINVTQLRRRPRRLSFHALFLAHDFIDVAYLLIPIKCACRASSFSSSRLPLPRKYRQRANQTHLSSCCETPCEKRWRKITLKENYLYLFSFLCLATNYRQEF